MADSDRPNSNLGAATNCGMASTAMAAVKPATPANRISLRRILTVTLGFAFVSLYHLMLAIPIQTMSR